MEALILSRSATAWAAGRRGDALRLLKDAVRADPTRSDVRLALAERYREMGNPDQAGRWGIVFEDWTTDIERDRLARLLASSWVRRQDVTEFLALPRGELPVTVTDLLNGPVERYRARFDLEARERGEGTSSNSVPSETLWGLFIAALLFTPLIVFGLAFFGSADVAVVRWLAFTVCALLAASLAATALSDLIDGERSSALHWAGASSVVIGLLLLYHVMAQA